MRMISTVLLLMVLCFGTAAQDVPEADSPVREPTEQTESTDPAELAEQVGILLSAGSPARPGSADAGGHGWAVMPRERGAWVLVHIPPRTRGLSSLDDTVPSGTLRRAASLSQPPIAIAAEGKRVVLFYAQAPGAEDASAEDGPTQRRPVRSLIAEPAGRGLYRYLPEGTSGTFTIEPSLTARGEIVSAVGAINSVFVLLDDRGAYELRELARDGWRTHALPADIQSPRLLQGHPTALAIEDASGRVIFGQLAGASLNWTDSLEVQWAQPRVLEPQVLWVGSRTVQVRHSSNGLAELAWGALPGDLSTVTPGLQFDQAQHGVAAIPMVRDGRLVLLFPTPPSTGLGGRTGPTQVVEISSWTGRTMYEGSALSSGPVSNEDFRLLALMLLALMTGVVVFVLRQPRLVDLATLPELTCLAPPGRRVAATLLDWVMLSTLAALILNTPLTDTVTVVGLLNQTGTGRGGGLVTLVSLLTIAWAWGTVFEGLFGRTPGKWLVGSRVVAVGPLGQQSAEKAPRVGLLRSAVRNFFKWFLLPWAIAEVMTPGARHRGDQAARAAVVLDLEEEPQDDPEDSGDPKKGEEG